MNDGRILVGTWGGGVFFYDSGFSPLPLPSSLKLLNGIILSGQFINTVKTGLVWLE
jgi:hypothetical protein